MLGWVGTDSICIFQQHKYQYPLYFYKTGLNLLMAQSKDFNTYAVKVPYLFVGK